MWGWWGGPASPGARRALCSVAASTAASPRPGSKTQVQGWTPVVAWTGAAGPEGRSSRGAWETAPGSSPLGAVTPGAPHTLRQPPQPILAKEQTSEHMMPWALRKPCPSPGLSFPIGKAERSPASGQGVLQHERSWGGPPGSWAQGVCMCGT